MCSETNPNLAFNRFIVRTIYSCYPENMCVIKFSVVEVSSVSVVTVGWGGAGVGFPTVAKSTLALEPTACRPVQWVPMAVTQGVKRPERGGDHSYPSDSRIRNAQSCTYTIHTPSWGCDCLSKGITSLSLTLSLSLSPHRAGPTLTC